MLVRRRGRGRDRDDEEEMLYKVFDFADKEAHEVMVPRPQVVAIEADLPAGGGARSAARVAVHALPRLPRLARRDRRDPARPRPLRGDARPRHRVGRARGAAPARLHRPGDEGPGRPPRRVPQAEPAHGRRRRRVRRDAGHRHPRGPARGDRRRDRGRVRPPRRVGRADRRPPHPHRRHVPDRRLQRAVRDRDRGRGLPHDGRHRLRRARARARGRRRDDRPTASSCASIEVEGSRIQRLEVEFARSFPSRRRRRRSDAPDRAARQDRLRRAQLPLPRRGAGRDAARAADALREVGDLADRARRADRPALDLDAVDYEAELGVVIGARLKGVPCENALEAVRGYLCANDVSARDLQRADKQFTRAKSLDTFWPRRPSSCPRPRCPIRSARDPLPRQR